MGGIGSGRKSSSPAMKSYWSKMTAEQRSQEMKRRRKIGKQKWLAKQGIAAASAENPFPPSIRNKPPLKLPGITLSRRNLRGLLEDLEAITTELKSMFGD